MTFIYKGLPVKKIFLKGILILVIAGLTGCTDRSDMDITDSAVTGLYESEAIASDSRVLVETEKNTDRISVDNLKYEYEDGNLVMAVYRDEWDGLDKSGYGYGSAADFLQEAAGYYYEIAEFTGKADQLSEYETVSIDFLFVDTISTTNMLSSSEEYYAVEIRLKKDFFELGAAPVAHELAHAICPSATSESLSEGLASYMQDTVSDNPAPHNFGINCDIICASVLGESDEDIKVNDILNMTGTVRSAFKEPEYRSLAYNFADSFTHYLIDNYGIDNYMWLYSAVNPIKVYPEITGKELDELRDDWRNHLMEEETMSAEEINEAMNEALNRQ